MLQASLTRRVHFSAAHKYELKSWSEQKNREFFGSCYSEHGHGHNYILEATVSGSIEKETGMIINLADFDKILKEASDPLDHSFLNKDVEYFKVHVPTTENIAIYLYEQIQSRLSKLKALKLESVKIYENEDLWSEVLA